MPGQAHLLTILVASRYTFQFVLPAEPAIRNSPLNGVCVAAKRASRPSTDQHELLRSLTFARSQVFVAEVQNAWHTSRESARLAIAATPAAHKRDVLFLRVDELARWFFTHIYQSLVARFEVGRNITTGLFVQLMAWCNEDVQWDIASALIPDATGNDRDDLPMPWARLGSTFYLALVADWVKVACAGWETNIGDMVDWRAPAWAAVQARKYPSEDSRCSPEQTSRLLREIATVVKTQVNSARSLAYEQALDIQLIAALADDTGDDEDIQAKLKRKITSISDIAGVESLTEIQHQCLSLRVEYGLTFPQIASHLGKDRKTVHENVQRAEARLRNARERMARQKSLARVKPGGLDSR